MPLGIDCKLYLNTNTYESPTWFEMAIVSDFMVDPNWDRQEGLTRETRVKRSVSTLLAMPFTGKVLVRKSNEGYALLHTAFLTGGYVDALILDGPITTNGSDGWRVDLGVSKFGDDQGVGVLRYKEFGMDPELTDHLPKIALVAGGVVTYSDPGPAA